MVVLVVVHHLMVLTQPQVVLVILHLHHHHKEIMVVKAMETVQVLAVAAQVLLVAMVQDSLLLAQAVREPHQAFRELL
jgi:hypothetical protein